jgi:hypothetical protein
VSPDDEPDEPEDIIEAEVRRSTEASGVPLKVTDEDTLLSIAQAVKRVRRSSKPGLDPAQRRQFDGFVEHFRPEWITVQPDWFVARIEGSTILAVILTEPQISPGVVERLRTLAQTEQADRYAILHLRPRFARLIPVELS